MNLPSTLMEANWVRMGQWRCSWLPKIKKEMVRVCKAPGWNPKVVKLDDKTDMVDLAMLPEHEGGRFFPFPAAILVTKIEDHPFLSELPKSAPRSVKQIYRAGFRLRALRVADALPLLAEIDRANADWKKYLVNREGSGWE